MYVGSRDRRRRGVAGASRATAGSGHGDLHERLLYFLPSPPGRLEKSFVIFNTHGICMYSWHMYVEAK